MSRNSEIIQIHCGILIIKMPCLFATIYAHNTITGFDIHNTFRIHGTCTASQIVEFKGKDLSCIVTPHCKVMSLRISKMGIREVMIFYFYILKFNSITRPRFSLLRFRVGDLRYSQLFIHYYIILKSQDR